MCRPMECRIAANDRWSARRIRKFGHRVKALFEARVQFAGRFAQLVCDGPLRASSRFRLQDVLLCPDAHCNIGARKRSC